MVGEPCGRASTSKLLFYFLKLGADFSDRKKKTNKTKATTNTAPTPRM